jgi:hypothetical protein
MATNVIADPTIGVNMPVTVTGTYGTAETAAKPPFPFGLQVRAFDNGTGTARTAAGVFQFAHGYSTASSAARGQFVQIRGNSAWILLAAQSNTMAPVGVAAGDLSNTNVWGWVQVQGIADYCTYAGSDVPAGKPQFVAAATGGIVLSNQVAGNQVYGVYAPVSLNSTGSALNKGTYQLNYPFLAGLTASNT